MFPSLTIRGYFEILEDTCVTMVAGRMSGVPNDGPRGPKFFFTGVGGANQLAKRGELRPRIGILRQTFENWVFHELTAHNAFTELFATLNFWHLVSGFEVDSSSMTCRRHRAKPQSKSLPIISKGSALWRRIIRRIKQRVII